MPGDTHAAPHGMIRMGMAVAPAVFAAIFLAACVTGGREPAARGPVPVPRREFRGLWVATVNGIDWPGAAGLSPEELAARADAILDAAARTGFNAVMFQARPASDAMYDSAIEPWSSFLTGVQGAAPGNGFDPLAYWVDAAHGRGLELHAWINPFRAGTPSVTSYDPASPVVARPELVRDLGGTGYKWIDPGASGAVGYVVDVVRDIMARYDVDGIVVDDYFYPYREFLAPGASFPDDGPYSAWLRSHPRAEGDPDSRGAFRRSRTELFMRGLAAAANAAKPWLRFGASPFGIWRPGYPEGTVGKDSWAETHADARAWLRAGFLDYLAPQLYWPAARTAQSYPLLLGWWQREAVVTTAVWPSLRRNFPVPADAPESDASTFDALAKNEAVSQLMIERAFSPESPGMLFYGATAILRDEAGIATGLREGPFVERALPPELARAAGPLPSVPAVTSSRTEDGSIELRFEPAVGIRGWALFGEDLAKLAAFVPVSEPTTSFTTGAPVWASAMDRFGRLGPAARIKLP
ncbi:MAG: family 10 glycosylhydrolase [Spirochaetes bacterium]|nr:family 10 glycosylhydrolase [Spirochaetota bacterium]